jgi:hypothetical protein
MNYMRPDATKETSCKNCIFAIYDGKTQIGCEDNRIEKFGDEVIEVYDDSREFYVIKRLCNLYRPQTWNNGERDIKKAKEESCLTFDILINCDKINDEFRLLIVDELNNLNYKSSKYKITLFHSYDKSLSEKEDIINICSKFPDISVSMYFDKKDYIYTFLSKASRFFHIIVDDTNIIGLGRFINKINDLVNNDLQKMVLCKSKDKIAISNIACRILYPSLYLDYQTNILQIEEDAKKHNLFVEV